MNKILHQLGYRYKWNLDSIINENTGDGFIAGPRYMPPQEIANIDVTLRRQSLFDPQFFLPNTRKGKLQDYPFFPDIVADGFISSEYGDSERLESARLCINFQSESEFHRIVIPARYRAATPSDFIQSQMELFVQPFIQSYHELNPATPLLLQLILNDSMIKDVDFRNSILNWVTGIDEIKGIYLIPHLGQRRKQVHDIDYLLGLLEFVHKLRKNNMEVVVGYLNTESILILAADPSAITIGSYENLRMFDLRAFEDQEDQTRRGPIVRVYISRLLQWISHQYIGAIRRVVRNPADFFDESHYRVTMFAPTYNWHFQKPEPYKHFFLVFSRQLREVCSHPLQKRIVRIKKIIQNACEEFQNLEESGIAFDSDSSGNHLSSWLTALNLFQRQLETHG